MATAAAVSNKFESFFETTLEDADPEIFGAIPQTNSDASATRSN